MQICSSLSTTSGRAIALLLLAWSATRAQTSAGGSIRGRVADASGSVVSAAVVVARSANVAGAFHVVTDAEFAHHGRYRHRETGRSQHRSDAAAGDDQQYYPRIGVAQFCAQ